MSSYNQAVAASEASATERDAPGRALLEPLEAGIDHVRGPGLGAVILEYGDYECPSSRLAFREIERVERRGEVRFAYRHYPLVQSHPRALAAAAAAEAAANQDRFWEMHEILFQRQRHLADSDLRRYARELGLDVARFDSDRCGSRVLSRVGRDVGSGLESGEVTARRRSSSTASCTAVTTTRSPSSRPSTRPRADDGGSAASADGRPRRRRQACMGPRGGHRLGEQRDPEARPAVSVATEPQRERRGRANERLELARHTISAGERVIYGQRVPGGVRLLDVPADGRGRRYVIERELTRMAELEAIVADYLEQSTRWDGVPVHVRTVGRR